MYWDTKLPGHQPAQKSRGPLIGIDTSDKLDCMEANYMQIVSTQTGSVRS